MTETLTELARQEEQPLSLAMAWNASVASREERPIEPRERIWASELGKGIHDVVLKLRGEIPSNPPNARSIRKFEAGNMFEWIVRLVLLRSGVLLESQTRLEYQYEGLLPVSGKLDFLAGGIPQYDKALDGLEGLMMPEFLERSMKEVAKFLQEKYPGGFEEGVQEVKSVSAYMFESLEKTRSATKNHRMQVFHYLKCRGDKVGKVIYICRDDLRMMEIEVFNSPENEEEYRAFIEEVTRIYNSGEMPMPEPRIVYDQDIEKFAKNWNVAYSAFLTKVYGFKDQKEFDDIHVPIVSRWNRVLMRQRAGKEMTKKNLDVIKEIEDEGYDFQELASRMKDAPPEEEDASEEYLASDL